MTDGERWARELLAELRASCYSPRAWRRFFARSFIRASEQRRAHSRAHRQAVWLGVVGFASWGVVAATGRPVAAAVGAVWWLAVVLMLDWHLGLLERHDGRPLDGLGLPNLLSLARAGLVPALPLLPPEGLAAVLVAAGITDVVDGRLARARDEVTRLGRWLDGAVDGFVLSVAAVAAVRADLLPAWIAGLVVLRYAAPWLLVAGVYFVRAEAPRADGHVSGRVPGVVLFAGLVLALLSVPGGWVLAGIGVLLGLAALGATVVRSLELRGSGSGHGSEVPQSFS